LGWPTIEVLPPHQFGVAQIECLLLEVVEALRNLSVEGTASGSCACRDSDAKTSN